MDIIKLLTQVKNKKAIWEYLNSFLNRMLYFFLRFTAIIPQMPPMIEPNKQSFTSEIPNSKFPSKTEKATNEIIVNINPITSPEIRPISFDFFSP